MWFHIPDFGFEFGSVLKLRKIVCVGTQNRVVCGKSQENVKHD